MRQLPPSRAVTNPLTALPYEPVLQSWGEDFYDPVAAADFPEHHLRFRNDDLLPLFGLDPAAVSDVDFIEAFGRFEDREPFLALRYHGYQFGEYNPNLGDGRGFLYGQVRGTDGRLYDLGTKGSGQTPYSRSADGRLTLKGGIREVLAGEALHRHRVRTSRCLSLIETGEQLWRHDEPSPTRAAVMVRLARTHIRFGTFERLYYLQRPDLVDVLLDGVIHCYYPHLSDIADERDRYAQFYADLVDRTAELAAQWMAAGFCHGVLNTDNMSVLGESFDYGPYAFIPTYSRQFTAASFDYGRRYCYGNQPGICRLNLQALQRPLSSAIAAADLDAGIERYDDRYARTYRDLMLARLGFDNPSAPPEDKGDRLVDLTVQLLADSQVPYPGFFVALASGFSPSWRDRADFVLENADLPELASVPDLFAHWQQLYQTCLAARPADEMERVGKQLRDRNPPTNLLRPRIEAVWEAIAVEDDWAPFRELLAKLRE